MITPTPECNHTSVGIIIKHGDRVLLIERKKFPFGFACPAGHVDDGEEYLLAAERELEEEVGIKVGTLEMVFEGRIDNVCRRPGGSWHYWKVYKGASTDEHVSLEPTEAVSYVWADRARLMNLVERTNTYRRGEISDEVWQKDPGLEPVWVDLLLKFA